MKHGNTPSNPARPLLAAGAPVSTPDACASASASASDAVPPARSRCDGWTPDKQKRFCEVLAECGIVARAADAVGMSSRSAYAFRSRAQGRAFAAVWHEARGIACRSLVDEAVSLAFQGRVVQVIENGEITTERRRNNPARLLRAVERLRSEAVLGDATVVAAAHDFERCLDLLVKGIAFPAPADHTRRGVSPEVIDFVRYTVFAGEAVPERPPVLQDDPRPEPQAVITGPHRWSAQVQRDFCEALARCGSVDKACRSIGKGRAGAYALRHRSRAFAIAWDAALLVVSEEMIDLALELASEGSVDTLYRQGKLVRVRRTTQVDAMLDTVARVQALRLPSPPMTAGFAASLDQLGSGALQQAIEAGHTGPHFTPELVETIRAAILGGGA